ncbi:MAG TPA: glycoside hydrolase family 9 protein [Candidatus Limnocylindrales bacterium]|nr:glycoside hydrolase family 9 protein [Candidatus Limnocylindrales bacterium]
MPAPGSYQLRLIAPRVLELNYIVEKKAAPARVPGWDFVDENGKCALPSPQEFTVTSQKKVFPVKAVGFKRRVLYAPFKHWDLRVANVLYLMMEHPIPIGQTVEVTNPSHKLWPPNTQFLVQADAERWTPAIHVNQTGYLPELPKQAMVGYYLGSLGELQLAEALGADTNQKGGSELTFKIVDAQSHSMKFQGKLISRRDRGFPFECYQQVLQADFTELRTPGQYWVEVPGLGKSFSFFIDDAVAGAFVRTCALGIYHQRCGTDNALPFTRFTHAPCHTVPAEVPTLAHKFQFVNDCLARMTEDYKSNSRHTAPQLKNVDASLYPFLNHGPVDVHGGHHDAGDYSKYTINSAAFIHHLVFAVDAFPGVKDLDNLGLPESDDGKSDVLQEAKWEADFLAKMQDHDGGFYFLVYPLNREYEGDVTPDHGDPQVVFPKTTSATAAATAALAQCASSPAFKQQFPEAAAQYLQKARKGWSFLQHALEKFGKDGAYQKITHYGDEFIHDDELAWAACEVYLATGDPECHKRLIEWLNPSDPATRRWGWWRLFDAYGCAVRSYAFASKTGRMQPGQLNPLLVEACQNEIAEAGADQLRRAQDSAYGTSFPEEAKKFLNAGWYFSSDAAFDLVVACQLDYPISKDPRAKMKEALISNLNYEEGCNPVNVTYLTGLGWHRQREIVHQYAQNDRRVLPPTGIPLGNVQAGFGWNNVYQKEPEALSFPPDGQSAPYPFYDRWGDAFNLTQEFVIVNQARALGYLAWLMASGPLKRQEWKPVPAKIVESLASTGSQNRVVAHLESPGLNLTSARIVWETEGREPAFGQTFAVDSASNQSRWIEAEAQLPDGRRAFGVSDAPPTAKSDGHQALPR